MDVIEERGVIYRPLLLKSCREDVSAVWVPQGVQPFYYSKVVWIDSLKFVFGSEESADKITMMVEASTGGIAANALELTGKKTIEKFIAKYKEKLASHKVSSGAQVVENFKNTFTIQLWQTKLWAL